MDFIIFFLTFYLFLLSVIGYGIMFQNLCFGTMESMNDQNVIYIGFFGLFFIAFISLLSSFFVAHSFIHNIFLHFAGIVLFFFINVKDKKSYLKIIFLISLFLFSALLISKTHDDFSYYHLPFTKYLTEQKVIFGMSNLGHGYKLLSSLFFLNSTFYIPFVEYFSFHFSLLYFLIFFNFFLFREIFSKENNDVIKFLYLFAFCYFNLSFNRLSEFGTDKVGQILIVILVIKIFQYTCFEKRKLYINNILYLIPLLGFCISLKTYFIPYVLIGFTIIFINNNFQKNFLTIFKSKSFSFFVLFLLIYFSHHFVSTGCLISPVNFTCFGDNLGWAEDSKSYKKLFVWLEQWSKGGASPNYQVDNPLEYIQNFNWLGNWIKTYFLTKILDQLGIMILIFIVIFSMFGSISNIKKKTILNKKIIFFYGIIFTIFLFWFLNHPQLRYGGYAIVFLTLSIPVGLVFKKLSNNDFTKNNYKYLIILVILIFNVKNINRVEKEFNRTDLYRFDNFPFYATLQKDYISMKYSSNLTIYKTEGHCWGTPTPCTGGSLSKIRVKKHNGYYFIYKFK